jgi:hypothetical protein
MADSADPPGTLLADRLDHLFRTVHPKDRGPCTHAEVAEAINAAAGDSVISATYVWQLRTGRRDNPTRRHLSALAAFFGSRRCTSSTTPRPAGMCCRRS